MSNMSYCRFENTRIDLDDCKDALEIMIGDPKDTEPLSARELKEAKKLAELCLEITTMLSEYVKIEMDDLTEDDVRETIEQINNRCGELDEEDEEEDTELHEEKD